MRKRVVLLLTISLAAVTVLAIEPALSYIPTPSAPEFTLRYVDNSYDVPTTATSTTDPYTNKTTTTTHPGYHVKKFDIQITIKNQPYPSTIDGNKTNLYYAIQTKGHFENWTEAYSNIEPPFTLPEQSSSEYTVLNYSADYYPSGAKVDFRIKAILGYTYTYYPPDHIVPVTASSFVYEPSVWSGTQTIALPTSATSPTFQLLAIIGTVFVSAVVAAGLLLYNRKRRKKA